ncbi:type II secretion system F family protein [Thermoproteota archaeon]
MKAKPRKRIKVKAREKAEERAEEKVEEKAEEKAEEKEKLIAPMPSKRPSLFVALSDSASNIVKGTAYYAGKAVRWPFGAKAPKYPDLAKKLEKEKKISIEEERHGPTISERPKIRISSSIIAPIKAWYRRLAEEEKRIISHKTKVPHSMQVEALKKKIVPVFEEEKVSSTLLTEEVDKIKGIMAEKKRYEIYQPSYFGSVANTLVRRFTFYLVDSFPGLFKRLYDSLRLANIRVLSNTYVNMMIFAVVISFMAFFVLFSFFFVFVKNPLLIVIPKALIMSVLVSCVVFILFYMYPSMRTKTREKNINTNLPFAINHVSAVAGSGVPPTRMFKLLVESDEYGEVAVELGKVVEYVDLFGYDLLTAIRSVSLTVPSATLKEFLEGIVSTVESGSELKDYLREKASEAMLAYELERQKYLETISTYSDVYTGILIAAPLFFIVALSLVSMLGGTIGGLEINLIIVMGAYVVIPLLNIIFLIFIELTQPEI